MAAVQAPDELFEVKEQFFLGNFSAATSAAASVSGLSDDERAKRDAFVYRAYIAKGTPDVVLREVKSDESRIPLRAVRALAEYTADESKRSEIADAVNGWRAAGSGMDGDETAAIVAATILASENRTADAFKCVAGEGSMEKKAMRVQLLLRMDRPDLARTTAEAMLKDDVEATLAVLSKAWVALYEGGPACAEAAASLAELRDRRGNSPVLSSAIGAAMLAAGRLSDAESAFHEAGGRGSAGGDSLVNLVATAHLQGKEETHIGRLESQMKAEAAGHPVVKQLGMAESALERAAAQAEES